MRSSSIQLKWLYFISTLLFMSLSLIIFLAWGKVLAISFACGWVIAMVNLFLIWALWRLVFQKKLIALVVVIIVLKYAILGLVTYKLIKASWLNPLGFAMGLLSNVLAITIFALFYKRLSSQMAARKSDLKEV